MDQLRTKKILLLGANGFVGTNVAAVLSEAGIAYTAASRSTGTDLRDSHATRELIKHTQPDFIINCAAHVGSLNYVTQQAASVISDNTKMLIALYEAVAAEVPHAVLIHPVANCAYPGAATLFKEEELMNGPLHPSVFAYGATRRFLVSLGESFAAQYGIKSIYLLVPNMYGPHDSTDPDKAHALNALISKFVKAEEQGNPELVIWGTGKAVREWLFARDFGCIVLEVLRDPAKKALEKPLNIAQKSGLSIKELVEIIIGYFHFSGKIVWNSSMPDGAPEKVMDDTKFRGAYPDFAFTSFTEGIPLTIDYYRSVYPY